MKRFVRRDDRAGVSEIVGTIMILAMTVVLFSGIILWVSSFPAPAAQTRLDIRAEMEPMYDGTGTEIGVNLTLHHQGGDLLQAFRTVIYVTSQRGNNPQQTDIVQLHLFNGFLASPNGLLDGMDTVWDIGERWAYRSYQLRSSDRITVTIVDTSKDSVAWAGPMNAPPGTRPPVFVDRWTDGIWTTEAIDPVQANMGFYLFTKVSDPDGDLNPGSVFAVITAWYGTNSPCELPLAMRDDGVFPDRVAGDQVFALGANFCMNVPFPNLNWAGSIILLNATDLQGHQTTTRFVLDVIPKSGGGGTTQRIPSELWQYIGYIQIRTGEVWVSNLNDPYTTTRTYQPYRITRDQLNGNGGALFHLKMANHGNTTIFIDGWTLMSFSKETSASVFPMCIVRPVNPNLPANAGGLGAYPGTSTNPLDFQYAQVFDVNPLDQETGGTPTVVLIAARTNFKADWPQSFVSNSYFINILISGMAGPTNMTYQQIINRWGPTYNPINHLTDADPLTRTTWYAQVIPFIGIVVY